MTAVRTGLGWDNHRIADGRPLILGGVHIPCEFGLDGHSDADILLHALTGSADAVGDWWCGVAGPGCAIDTDRWAVLSPNLLGSCYGSSGPSEGGERFPAVTTRDMARAVGVLDVEDTDAAGLHQRREVAGVAGVAAAHHDHRVDRLVEVVPFRQDSPGSGPVVGVRFVQRPYVANGGGEPALFGHG